MFRFLHLLDDEPHGFITAIMYWHPPLMGEKMDDQQALIQPPPLVWHGYIGPIRRLHHGNRFNSRPTRVKKLWASGLPQAG